MKPCKVDKKKKEQVRKLQECMHSKDYYWEEKLDGISIMAIGGRLFSNSISKETGFPGEKTYHLPQISGPLSELGSLILDGEAYREGWKCNQVTSITNVKDASTAISKQAAQGNIQYWVYDMLRDIDGTWMVNWPFEKRRARLEELFATVPGVGQNPDIVLNKIYKCSEVDPGPELERILAAGLEGIVLKHKDGKYEPGKRPMWNQIKVKANMEDDVVIMGFLPATRKYTGKNLEGWPHWENGEPVTSNYAKGLIGSIRIGKYDDQGELVCVGSVTGITQALREDMTSNPENYIGRVIKIKGMEKTEDGAYRHANFLEFHPDKRAEECKVNEND